MQLTRDNPYLSAYTFYGDPNRLVEFRLLSLNNCSMDCRGCFYKREENNFCDFKKALNLAKDLKKNEYQLETCYLLPTDIFDNKENYKLFDSKIFCELISMFNFCGIASTLEDGFDEKFFDILFEKCPETRVELQVNLSIKRLEDLNYNLLLKSVVPNLKDKYQEKIVINLAINVGFEIEQKEFEKLKQLIKVLSEDGILELNFTFLYNKDISFDKQKKMLKKSIGTVNKFGKVYEEDESFRIKFNDRTLLRKPSFVFVDDPAKIYLTPIVPFDEYVFIRNDKYVVEEPSLDGFLKTFHSLTEINTTILDKCESCQNLTYCMGKGYFAIAKDFELECVLEIEE